MKLKQCGVWLGIVALMWSLNVNAADDPRRPPAMTTTNVPTISDALANRLRQFQNTRAATFRGWAPDGRGMLIQTRFGNTVQLHRVYEPGGRREQITFFEEPTDGHFVPADEHGYYATTATTDHALDCLKDHAANHKDQPFFLYVPHNMPHVPLAVSSKFKGKTGQLYSDVMLEIDWSVGQIMDALKGHPLEAFDRSIDVPLPNLEELE